MLDLDLTPRFSETAALGVAADGVTRAFVVPQPQGLCGKTYLLRLKLEDAARREVSRNSYWLSTQEDELDWEKMEWYYTPTKQHADLKALGSLPVTTLALASRVEKKGPEGAASVQLRNDGKALAFQVHVKVVDAGSGEEVLPVFFDDNYFELLPGETRTIHASFPLDRPAARLAVEAEAWNAAAVRR